MHIALTGAATTIAPEIRHMSSEQFRPGNAAIPSPVGPASPDAFSTQLTSLAPQILRPETPRSSVFPLLLSIAAVLMIAIVATLVVNAKLSAHREMQDAFAKLEAIYRQESLEVAGPAPLLLEDADIRARLVGRWHRELLDTRGIALSVELTLAADGAFEARVLPAKKNADERIATGVWHVRERRLRISPAPNAGTFPLREHSEEIMALGDAHFTTRQDDGKERSAVRASSDPAALFIP
jgi:hypothetical protein